ncbi:cytochrome c oxidase assembly factor 1 family protein [uncultured Dokdonia sp.]|uniref:cytochrome c oxidase assembly factor 1 family protein n=1 Tax=uncultured Dokdonia sp. TaxID=575653 RepID=UPI0026068B7A|nr:cytochrome c oxidase assembly factor 1 family protein [uncultured Dokdonia sp.]
MTDQNELIQEKSWWKRNWKWALPVGGCGGCLIIVILFIGGVFAGVTTMFTSSTPYQEGLEKVNSNEQVVELLGTPIEKDGIMQGSINFNNGDGEADFNIPIKGPKGEGRLYIVGEKRNDEWTYSEMEVRIDQNNEVINLLNEGLDKPEEEEDF